MLITPIAVALCASLPTTITPLVDRDVFAGVPHTLIDFETRGDGITPINLFPNSAVIIPNDEYISSGILFEDSDVGIFHLSENTAIWEAFIAQSSPDNAFGGTGFSESIVFLNEIHSVGFELVFANLGFGVPPSVQAFDTLDNLLGEIIFDTTFIDGTTGLLDQNGFGFMGLSSTTPIAKITFDHMFDAFIDDLHFSAATIPAPGVLTLALPMALAGARRRRY